MLKRSMATGFAGIENPLFYNDIKKPWRSAHALVIPDGLARVWSIAPVIVSWTPPMTPPTVPVTPSSEGWT